MLRETRQDLFRAETKVNAERTWRWPIRVGCVALGVVGLAAWQNDGARAGGAAFAKGVFGHMREGGFETILGLAITGGIIWLAVFLVRRWLRGPTPEQQARKLMEGFARSDGVASYVFAGQSSLEPEIDTDGEAALVGALTRPENKRFRQRRLTQDNRPLASSLTTILDRQVDSSGRFRPNGPATESA
jgi:hypothetical protein